MRCSWSCTRPSKFAIANAVDVPANGTVADIGGGNGSLLAKILQTRPNVRGVLVDLPEILRDAEDYLLSVGVRHRCELVPQSFFDPLELAPCRLNLEIDACRARLWRTCADAIPFFSLIPVATNSTS